jgi:membrane protease YdiL (CAAX protease family)
LSANDTTLVPPPPQAPPAPRTVAPAWHTIVYLLIMAGLSALSAHSQLQMVDRHGRIVMYVTTIVAEWLLVGYIAWGLRLRKLRLCDIIGGRWQKPEDALLDVGVAIGFWITALIVLAGVAYLAGFGHMAQVAEARKNIGRLLPQSAEEIALWVALCATAGFCEEVMFRGYLQSQFTALTRKPLAAIALQALVFGIGHAYQGARLVIVITVFGFLFGSLAWWRRSLRPGMIAHAWQDLFSGLASRAISRM